MGIQCSLQDIPVSPNPDLEPVEVLTSTSDLPHSASPEEIDDLEAFLNQVIPPTEAAEGKGKETA